MASRTTFTFTDYSLERSNFSVEGVSVSSANYDAQQTAVIALTDAIEDITIGQLGKREFVSSVAFPNTTTPTDPFAQRELKWFVRYADNVNGNLQSVEIATPDLQLLVPGSDLMDLTSTEGAAFVTAFEAFVRSADGNQVTVQSVRLVGRKL